MQAQMGERKWTSVTANAQDEALAVHYMATQPIHRDMDAPAATSGTAEGILERAHCNLTIFRTASEAGKFPGPAGTPKIEDSELKTCLELLE